MQCSDCGATATVYVVASANDWTDSDYLCDKCSYQAHAFMTPYLMIGAGFIEETPIGRDESASEHDPEDGSGAVSGQEPVV
jgi:hypothetical protein